jgi:hypothetical protein
MEVMAQYTNNDDMYIGLLINKAKLCTSSNATILDTNVKSEDTALEIKKVNDDNQILTLMKRIEAIERKIQEVESRLVCNSKLNKSKKE